jgi:predicted ATPase
MSGGGMSAGEDSKPRGWRFTDGKRVFRLYREQRRLFEGDTEVSMGQRAFDLLVFFAENAGRPLGKKEIMKGAWRGVVLADSSLTSHVWAVRKVVGEGPITVINNYGYQFTSDVEPEEAPEPAPRPARPLISLPHRSSAGIGRTAELAELAEHCTENRLVTVIGPGGIGKSWLAVQLSWRLAEDFPDGVHLIDLAPVRELMGVASAIARVLDVALRGGEAPLQILATAIGQRYMLLIFDSCEYVTDAAGDFIKGLLARAPNLRVLATSQQILHVPNELVYRLQPLPAEDAIALFVQCAHAADRRFTRNDVNSAAITEICRQLEGNPLMLEMAAALVPSIGVKEVRAGLSQRFEMLDSSPFKAEPRQATLSAVTEWSYGLLDATDRRVFRRLACFSGSFSADAAVALAGPEGATRWDVLACLHRLVDKSLLIFETGDQDRYRMPETLRLHARTRLFESSETEALAERHAWYFTDLFERADEAWETTSDADWLATYAPDIDNVRAALDWALANARRVPIAITLAGATGPLWDRLALSAEGRNYLDRLVDLLDNDTPPASAARLIKRAATLWRPTDRLRSVALMERAVAIYRQVGDRLNLGIALSMTGGNYVFLGRHADAEAALAEAQALLSGSDRTKSLTTIMTDLGTLANSRNRIDDAARYYGIALELAQTLKDSLRENITLLNLGEVEFRRGATERAIECAREATRGLRGTTFQRPYLGWPLNNLATYLTLYGKSGEARVYAEEALSLLREEGGYWLRVCLQTLALLGACEGRHTAAAQLIGFVDAGYARSGEVREFTELQLHDRLSALLTENLAADDIAAWAAAGARWNEARAVDFALGRILSPDGVTT